MHNRLHADIRPLSYWRHLYALGYLLFICVVVWMAQLALWVFVVVILLAMMSYLVTFWSRSQPLHMTAPDEYNYTTYWQLLYKGRYGKELWEAELIGITDFGQCIGFDFKTVHPMMVNKNVVIWQDQVDNEAWRKMKVLSRWH